MIKSNLVCDRSGMHSQEQALDIRVQGDPCLACPHAVHWVTLKDTRIKIVTSQTVCALLCDNPLHSIMFNQNTSRKKSIKAKRKLQVELTLLASMLAEFVLCVTLMLETVVFYWVHSLTLSSPDTKKTVLREMCQSAFATFSDGVC